MNRLAHRYLPPLLYAAFGFAVVAYAWDTTRVVDFSLAVNQYTLQEMARVCNAPRPTHEGHAPLIELVVLR